MGSASSRRIRVGGVPEHFNMPWHLAMESGATAASGLSCDWREYASGTGAMLSALSEGELDLAMLLTEGAALGLARGLPIEALSLYTRSPLIWGIHVPPGAGVPALSDLGNRRFAISRHGSGSHLMSLAMAIENGWPIDTMQFVVVDNLPGAVTAFAEGRADVFLWEHYTTAPTVQRGDFSRIGDFVSPWPAWVICGNSNFLRREQNRVEQLLQIVMTTAVELSHAADAAARIAERYALEEPAVAAWLTGVEWVNGPASPQPALADAAAMLRKTGT